jgi:hypothetical protein
MGSGRFDADDWKTYSTTHSYDKATTTAAHIYTSKKMLADLDPKLIKDPSGNRIRESRDSADNPKSTPIIVGLDVTGSMAVVLEAMAKVGLKTLFEEIYKRKPVEDPHVLCAAIGDAYCDNSPLQVTQFEADLRIAEQLANLYLEGGGGGNDSEGYSLLHYFAAKHTSCDAFEKRKKKGYLFTIGDDGPTPEVTADHASEVFGDKTGENISAKQLLTLVSRQWEVFHLMVAEGGTFSESRCVHPWRKLLGERALTLKDHTKMAEVIVSTIQVIEGAKPKEVVGSWDGNTAMVVHEAINGLTAHNKGVDGVVTL